MKAIKQEFSISDLEKLSGIKAHTIRIWEKRYGLLQPKRSESNIRKYDMENLQELLNTALLIQNGHKISKIAKMDANTMKQLVEQCTNHQDAIKEIQTFQLAMLHFDSDAFERHYQQLTSKHSFRTIFTEFFLPLLKKIGVDWQIAAITPAHEHFISNLIRQKLFAQIDQLQVQKTDKKSETVNVLFLPEGEMHEIGLLYIHYEILLKNCHSIYLGHEIPLENLVNFKKSYSKINYISYFTVSPTNDQMNNYLQRIEHFLLRPNQDQFHVFGLKTKAHAYSSNASKIHLHRELSSFIEQINEEF